MLQLQPLMQYRRRIHEAALPSSQRQTHQTHGRPGCRRKKQKVSSPCTHVARYNITCEPDSTRQRMRGCKKHLQACQHERARHCAARGGDTVSQRSGRQCLTYMAGEDARSCAASGMLLPQNAALLGAAPAVHSQRLAASAGARAAAAAPESAGQLAGCCRSRRDACTAAGGSAAASRVTSTSSPGSPPCGASAECTAA